MTETALSTIVERRPEPEYRLAMPDQIPDLYDHLRRLGLTSRYFRFGNQVRDEMIAAYCRKSSQGYGFVLCARSAEILRGVAEIRLFPGRWPLQGELALSVEDDWQDSGIGSTLVARALSVARDYRISRVRMTCLAENSRMRHIARKFHAGLICQAQEVWGLFEPLDPIYQNLLSERRHLPVPFHS